MNTTNHLTNNNNHTSHIDEYYLVVMNIIFISVNNNKILSNDISEIDELDTIVYEQHKPPNKQEEMLNII